jgi:subtilisin family serine protease
MQDGVAHGQTTGRMIAVNMNKPTAAASKSMLKEIASSCGLGGSASKVCGSSDFAEAAIDESSAASAEVIMLEDLGIALLNGDVDQNAAAASMAASSGSQGIVMEPEYINYALGFDESFSLDEIPPEQDIDLPTSGGQAVDMDTIRTILKLLCKVAGTDGATSGDGDAGVGAVAAARCFSDTAASTWGLKATNVIGNGATGAGIKVAVLDSGMDVGHPDFAGRNPQTAVFQTSSIDRQIHDVNGHGTHCIGTSCGPVRSQFGPRYGIASQAQIFAGKVLANSARGGASGGDFAILRGIQWAISNRCAVISMSLGAPVSRPGFPQSYERAAQNGLRLGSLIIAATGNSSRRPGNIRPVGRPANCPSILGVAAVDRCIGIAPFSDGRRFSQVGAEVNLSGPGVRVLSSVPRQLGSTGLKSGTSMATPHVAGIAALIAEQTGLRGVPLYREMRRRARRLGNFNDFGNGLGRV